VEEPLQSSQRAVSEREREPLERDREIERELAERKRERERERAGRESRQREPAGSR
jgi:hypothetical protein